MSVQDEVADRAKEGKPPPSSALLGGDVKSSWILVMRPIEDFLIERSVHPNVLTVTSLVVSVVAGALFHFGFIFFAGIVLIAGSTFDMLDGRVARAQNITTKSGAYFDSVLDRVSEMVILLGLLSYFLDTPFAYVVFIIAGFSMMVSYTRARAEGLGVKCEVGMMQRPERIVYLGAASVFNFFGNLLGVYAGFGSGDYILKLSLGIIALFSIVTTFQRFSHVLGVLKGREKDDVDPDKEG